MMHAAQGSCAPVHYECDQYSLVQAKMLLLLCSRRAVSCIAFALTGLKASWYMVSAMFLHAVFAW
jgi:hypothetical protein